MMKKEHGWIRIVEAFTMILLIAGIFLIVLNKNSPKDFSQEVYEKEQGILKGIQLNDSLRKIILSFNEGSLPIEWVNFPENLIGEISSKTPSYLECEARICRINDDCILSSSINEDIYTQEAMIASTLEVYSPRKLKLFCWGK